MFILNPYRHGAAFTNLKSLVFDGVDEKVTISNDSSNWPADSTDEFSVSFWVKSPVESDNRSVCFQRSVATSHETGFKIHFNYYKHLIFDIITSLGTVNYWGVYIPNSTDDLKDDAWHHVVCTYDGSEGTGGMKIYGDNTENAVSYKTTGTAGTNLQHDVFIGESSRGTMPFEGYLDEVSFWDKELSISEVSDIYNSGSPNDLSLHSAASNLIGWWRGDGDTYPTISDNSALSNDGTMVNMEAGDINTTVP